MRGEVQRQGRRTKLPTPHHTRPAEWDKRKGRIKGMSGFARARYGQLVTVRDINLSFVTELLKHLRDERKNNNGTIAKRLEKTASCVLKWHNQFIPLQAKPVGYEEPRGLRQGGAMPECFTFNDRP